MQIGQDILKISNGILRTKTQWVLMENPSNPSGKISHDLHHWPFSRRSRRTWQGRTWSRRISKTRSSWCLRSMTSSEKIMMRNASRMPSKSKITRTGFYRDIGLFWVQVRKRKFTLAHRMDNGTVQPTKWFTNSKKLVILFSQLPVLWVEEFWKKEKGRSTIHFNGEFFLWTQNSYSKQFILWIRPTFTRLLRIGVTNLLWRRQKENTFSHLWTIDL